MNRTTTIAALAGLSISTLCAAQPASTPPGDPVAPARQPGAAAQRLRTPAKPSMVDLQEAAKAPRKRAARPQPAPVQPAPAQPALPTDVPVQPAGVNAGAQRPAALSQVDRAAAPAPSASLLSSATGDGADLPPGVSTMPLAPLTAPASTNAVPTVDIDTVASKPEQGGLRRPVIDLDPRGRERSLRAETAPAVSPVDPPALTAGPQPITPAAADRKTDPTGPASQVEWVPVNRAAPQFPAMAAPPAVSSAYVERLASQGGSGGTATPTGAPADAPVAAATPVAPQPEGGALGVPAAPLPAPAPVATPAAPAEPQPPASHVDAPPSPAPAAPAITRPAQPEPLPPVQPAEVTPSAPDPRPAPLPADAPVKAPEQAPAPAAPVKPGSVTGPEISAVDPSKIKLPAAPAASGEQPPAPRMADETIAPASAPVARPLPQTAPTVAAPPTPVTAQPPAAGKPVSKPAPAGAPQPVALKVLSLTGTPGMVQWQVDGGSQWLIPEVDEQTRGRFVVRTGPDAGVEVQIDDAARVRLGRFTRAELRSVEAPGEPGAGAGGGDRQLNIELLRGVVYVTPDKGKTVSVRTPARVVAIKEPTQITHDNSGTRSVTFVEQPNPGSSAAAPGANP